MTLYGLLAILMTWNSITNLCFIKWTQHIGFLTLAGMEQVVEGNLGNDLKEG